MERRLYKSNENKMLSGVCFLAAILNHQFGILSLVFGANMEALLSGAFTGLGLLFELIGFYNDMHDVPFMQRKKALFSRKK